MRQQLCCGADEFSLTVLLFVTEDLRQEEKGKETERMAIKYQGITGQIYLAGKQLASGGEGIIFEIEGNRSQVIKIFKEGKRDGGREEKLREMVQAHLSEEAQEEITWPQDIVYNKEGFVGYVMPKIEKCESLASVYNSGANGYYDLRYRLLVAVNLCYAIQTVHEMGQVCGDLNPQNISVNLDTSDKDAFHVTLMDADSYHFTSGDKTYRCEVGLGDYIAPEIQNRMSKEVTLKTMALPTYTKETDLFALAVHIFSLLMNGCHPFACAKASGNGQDETLRQMSSHYVRDSVATPQPIENIRNGYFPFYEKREGIVTPIYAPEFEALPEGLRELFIATFVYGYSDPKKRATTEEWIAALYEAKSNIVSCGKGHYYFDNAAQCPMCSVEERIVALLGGTEAGSSSERGNSSETTSEAGTNKSAPPYGGRNVGTAKKRRWTGRRVAAIASIVILSVFMIIGLYAPTSVTPNYDEQSMQEETQSEVQQSKEEWQEVDLKMCGIKVTVPSSSVEEGVEDEIDGFRIDIGESFFYLEDIDSPQLTQNNFKNIEKCSLTKRPSHAMEKYYKHIYDKYYELQNEQIIKLGSYYFVKIQYKDDDTGRYYCCYYAINNQWEYEFELLCDNSTTRKNDIAQCEKILANMKIYHIPVELNLNPVEKLKFSDYYRLYINRGDTVSPDTSDYILIMDEDDLQSEIMLPPGHYAALLVQENDNEEIIKQYAATFDVPTDKSRATVDVQFKT